MYERINFVSLISLPMMLMLSACFPVSSMGQSRAVVTKPVNVSEMVALSGNVHPLVAKSLDLGETSYSENAGRMLVVLKRSDAQEKELQQFLKDTQRESSSSFHQWLTPEVFGAKFGLQDTDVAQVTDWLQSQGLSVARISRGKTTIEFSGTVGQVNQAFQTSMHKYRSNGEIHHANATSPKVPAALAPAIASITNLNDFGYHPQAKVVGSLSYSTKTKTAKPTWTHPEGTAAPLYLLTPEDFATQYDLKPVYANGTKGAGQTIGILNESNIDISLVNAYRKLFGLKANPPQVVIDGTDPGATSAQSEAYLDVENAGAVAPDASIKLYIASTYGITGGGLSFSLVRAVDDNDASVLSVSFSVCEESGNDLNHFINAEWEQAAAQGQTVLVSTGDSGTYSCEGPGANALASTPWDMAIGGTDVYVSDYASGGTSMQNYWNASNDASLGSLQKPMIEQPWNDSIYGLNNITYDSLENQPYNSDGGGGGASYCAQSHLDSSGNVVCDAGYPKPSWQAGLGVPSDGVRDIPDISMFASNAANGVTWPICASPGDCTLTDPTTGLTLITGVGGTSASAPAMAGVMSLVNQLYGRQGQANYTLYRLAAQIPSVINSVDIGSINEPCDGQSHCLTDANGNMSYQEYYANPGYDLATGLGTVDISLLLNNWAKVTTVSSSTTLTLTPVTAVHGSPIKATVAVTGNSGTPSGAVALVTDSSLLAQQGQTAFDLVKGSATGSLTFLPGGTYNVTAQYSGDSNFGASKSTSTQIKITPEDSAINYTATTYDGAFYTGPITANSSVAYGNSDVFDIVPSGVSGSAGVATGTATYTDGATVVDTMPITSAGTGEYATGLLAVGPHSIGVKYSGDSSYNASTGTPLIFNVVKATPSISSDGDPAKYFTSQGGYVAGQNAIVTVSVYAPYATYGAAPTGTVTYQLGTGTPGTVALTLENILFSNAGVGVITLPNLAVGTQRLTLNYSGDAHYLPKVSFTTIRAFAPTLIPTSVKIAITSPADLTTVTNSTYIVVTATVQGTTQPPTGSVNFFLAGFVESSPKPLVAGPNNTATATLTKQVATFLSGVNSLNAAYEGDSTYSPSSSNTINLTSDQTDFSFATATPNLVVASGSEGNAPLSLTSISGFNSGVTATCVAPAALTCSLTPSSVTLNGSATLTLNVKTKITVASNATPQLHLRESGGVIAMCFLLLFSPLRRKTLGRLAILLVSTALIGTMGCAKNGTPASTQPVTQNATSGTYNIVVNAVSTNGINHSLTFQVVVQ